MPKKYFSLKTLALSGLIASAGLISGYVHLASAAYEGSPLSASAAQLGIQVAQISQTPGIWNGQGDLPGAFQLPWKNPDTHFDPLFRTSYWSEATGPINDPSAPWNQNIASYYGSAIYNAGLYYLGGKYYASPIGIEWLPQTDSSTHTAAAAR